MEFFKIMDVRTTEKGNQEKFCESIFPLEDHPEVCLTGGMWGEFTVRRDEIMGGIRFFNSNICIKYSHDEKDD